MSETKFPLDKLVQLIEIDVRKQLGGEIAYGKATAGRCMKEALRMGKASPILERALDPAALGGIQEHDLFQKILDRIVITRPIQARTDQVKQNAPVYVHEIALYVKFQGIAALVIIVRTGTQMMLQPLDAEKSPLSFAARIGIVYESRFKYGFQLIVEIMMYDSVPEGCGEDFPLHRVADYEAHAAARSVGAAADFFIQGNEICRQVPFEAHL